MPVGNLQEQTCKFKDLWPQALHRGPPHNKTQRIKTICTSFRLHRDASMHLRDLPGTTYPTMVLIFHLILQIYSTHLLTSHASDKSSNFRKSGRPLAPSPNHVVAFWHASRLVSHGVDLLISRRNVRLHRESHNCTPTYQ